MPRCKHDYEYKAKIFNPKQIAEYYVLREKTTLYACCSKCGHETNRIAAGGYIDMNTLQDKDGDEY